MAKVFRRPKNKKELENLESSGLWKAQAFGRKIAESGEKITLDVILSLHKVFLEEACPEYAGRFRKDGEDIKKLLCLEPPPGRLVRERMYVFWRNFDSRLSQTPKIPKSKNKEQQEKWLDGVLTLATWVQYQIAAIHPFCEGNGRMARLMTNIILRRFGLQPSDIKYEGVDKKRYLEALCQIDRHQNYELLKSLIAKSMYNTYQRVYQTIKRSAAKK